MFSRSFENRHEEADGRGQKQKSRGDISEQRILMKSVWIGV